jgi:hypothetical protein
MFSCRPLRGSNEYRFPGHNEVAGCNVLADLGVDVDAVNAADDDLHNIARDLPATHLFWACIMAVLTKF